MKIQEKVKAITKIISDRYEESVLRERFWTWFDAIPDKHPNLPLVISILALLLVIVKQFLAGMPQ